MTTDELAKALFDEWVRLHPFPPMPAGWGWNEANKPTWRAMAYIAIQALKKKRA